MVNIFLPFSLSRNRRLSVQISFFFSRDLTAFSKASFWIPCFVNVSYNQIVESGFSVSIFSIRISRSPSMNMADSDE